MTDIELPALLADSRRAGTCRIHAHERTAMLEAAATLGFAVVTLDLALTRNKTALLEGIATAFDFPPDFGHNWDALADSLGDLSWRPAPGYMLVLEQFDALHENPSPHLATLMDILDQVSQAHAQDGTPFWVLLIQPASSPEAGGDGA